MTILAADGSAHRRLALLIPCQDAVGAGFAFDLARLTGALAASGVVYTLLQHRGSLLPQQRATLVTAAQTWGATHALWLDSDMRFPPDTADRLLAHGEPIVAANYSTRRPPILPTAEHRTHGHLFTSPDATGLEEVTQAGMGVMLVDMAVYARLAQPWFILGFNPKTTEYIGEDVFFLRKAREHGFRTLIDQDLSQDVRHAGEMEYRAAHACVTRDAYNAQEPHAV